MSYAPGSRKAARKHAKSCYDRLERIAQALRSTEAVQNAHLRELRKEARRRRFSLRNWGKARAPRFDAGETPDEILPKKRSEKASIWSLVRFVLAGLVILTIVFGLLVWAFFEPVSRNWVASRESPAADRAALALRCADSVQLSDYRGRKLGALRRHREPVCHGQYLTIEFEDGTAMAVAEAIGTIEGRFKRTDPTLFGLDMLGLARAAAHETERRQRGFSRMDVIHGKKKTWVPLAGSPPLVTTVERLAGEPHPQSSLSRKVAYLRAAAIFDARHLRGDDTLRARFLSGHLPVLEERGQAYGGALAAEHLFGGMPTSLGERCLFASAAGFPFRMPFNDAPEYWRSSVNIRLARVKDRAASKCADELAGSPEELEEALQVISSFDLPAAPHPRLSTATLVLLDDPLIFPVTNHVAVRLTLDAELQHSIEQSVPAYVRSIGPSSSKQDWLLAIGEIAQDGSVELRAASASRRGLLAGPGQSEGDVVRHRQPDIGLGSQVKIALALLAAREGYHELCNRQVGAISNASGPPVVSDCLTDEAGLVDIRTATARSLNLPFAALAEDHPADIRKLHNTLGWLGPDMGSTGAALGIGRTPSPSQIMTLAAAIDQGRFGRPLYSGGLSVVQGEAGREVDLSRAGYTARHGAEAAAILQAPLGPDGTLATFRRDLGDTGCRLIWGKSGSPEITGGTIAMGRSATVIAECGTRRFVFFAMITSGDNRIPVKIRTHQLSKMMRPALEHFARSNCAAPAGCQISYLDGETP